MELIGDYISLNDALELEISALEDNYAEQDQSLRSQQATKSWLSELIAMENFSSALTRRLTESKKFEPQRFRDQNQSLPAPYDRSGDFHQYWLTVKKEHF